MRTKTKKNELEIPPPHQSIKLFPGLWINLSKKGGSLSVGGHGLTANIKEGRA
jgi:hypothetical protein